MARLLDAPLVASGVSRLVYDCNRPPEADDAIAAESAGVAIPGNVGLTAEERRLRMERYYAPFHRALAACIDGRLSRPRAPVQVPVQVPVLLTVHSFTPVYDGVRREMDLGILHDADARFADLLIDVVESDGDLMVRRNAPYGPKDGVTHTLIEHGLRRGLPNAMVEIRNDLIESPETQNAMAARLARYAAQARAAMESMANPEAARAGGAVDRPLASRAAG